jgi:hypothetical protein
VRSESEEEDNNSVKDSGESVYYDPENDQSSETSSIQSEEETN